MLSVSVTERDTKEKPKALRKKGLLPAVFYGRKEESTPVSVSDKEFGRIFQEAGESTIVSLNGVGEPKEALIHDVDFHPVTGKPRHVDFYVIEKGKKLTVDVPIAFVGESPAVKSLGGTLVKVLHEIEIEALPKDLPHEITIDVSTLTDFDSQIAIKDVAFPEGVTATADRDDMVVAVEEPREEEEEEVPTDIDMEAIEVSGEKKEEGEEGEGAPAAEGGEEKE